MKLSRADLVFVVVAFLATHVFGLVIVGLIRRPASAAPRLPFAYLLPGDLAFFSGAGAGVFLFMALMLCVRRRDR